MPRLRIHCSAARCYRKPSRRKNWFKSARSKEIYSKLYLSFSISVPQLIQKSTGEGKSYGVERTLVEVFREDDLNRQLEEGEKSWSCSTSRGKKLSILEVLNITCLMVTQLLQLLEEAAVRPSWLSSKAPFWRLLLQGQKLKCPHYLEQQLCQSQNIATWLFNHILWTAPEKKWAPLDWYTFCNEVLLRAIRKSSCLGGIWSNKMLFSSCQGSF